MKYKLVAVDLDGTLLNSQGKISDKTVHAILKAKEKGYSFTICTGRPVQGIKQFVDILNLSGIPMITYNGAMIVKAGSLEVLFEQQMSANDARQILSWGKKLNTTVIVWSDNRLYVNALNDNVQDYKQISGVEPALITNEDALIKQGITKILWYDDPAQIKHYQDILLAQRLESVTYCTSKPAFLEFFDRRVSKAIALEKVGEELGIRREEIIAIGDGFNDLPMIEYAGLGVAMGNSTEDIKNKADYVTLTNDEDGVAYFLEYV